jgi:hypothetical protein
MKKLLEFRIWGGWSDCDAANRLTSDMLVQQILYAIRNVPKTTERITEEIHADKRAVQDALTQLHRCHLVYQSSAGETWEARIGIFSKEDVRVAQELGKKYGDMEAAILGETAHAVREVFEGCLVAKKYPWKAMSNIILGGLIADICVLDRAPFRTEYRTASFLPPLQPDGTRWEYTGYELDKGKIYPMLKWTFYHNQYKDSHGGFARWGCFEEDRAARPNQPEMLFFFGGAREILTLLCGGNLTLEWVCKRTRLTREFVEDQIEEMHGFNPPAIAVEGDQLSLNFPILGRNDLAALLTKGDEVAEIVHNQVTKPYQSEREQISEERGLRAILPGNVLAREFALQRLIEDGILSLPPVAPAPWNAGVWGWLGPLPMWDEVVQPVDGG